MAEINVQILRRQPINVTLNKTEGQAGATTFLALTDTPADYTGYGGKVVAVKDDESGLEFITQTGGGGAVDSVNGQVGAVVLDPDDLDDSLTSHKFISATELSKLSGIASGAQVNNISNANATDLTDGGATTLHKHSYNNLDDKPSIPTQYTDELAQDAIGGILTNTGNVQFTYTDSTPSITASVDLSGRVAKAGDTMSGNLQIQTGHSLALDNTVGDSTLYLFNNGAPGASILQTGANFVAANIASGASVIGSNTGDQTLSSLGAEAVANKSTNVTTDGASDTKYPSVKAVKDYADQLIGAANAVVYKGATDCSGNPNYPAADAGFIYFVSVAGKIGGASGVAVEVGDMYICTTDGTTTGDQATKGSFWNVIQKNIADYIIGPASVTDGTIPLFDNVTGKLLKGSNYTPASFAPALGNDDNYVTDTEKSNLHAPQSDNQTASDFDIKDLTDSTNLRTTWSGKQNAITTGTTSQYLRGDLSLATFPTIPSALSALSDDSTHRLTTDTEKTQWNKRVISVAVTDPNGVSLTTGDGKAYIRISSVLNGLNLVGIAAHTTTVSSSGAVSVAIYNVTDSVDMLSTNVTIDANAKDSTTATTPAVIDTTHDDVATADELRIDIDGAGTGAKGLIIDLIFS